MEGKELREQKRDLRLRMKNRLAGLDLQFRDKASAAVARRIVDGERWKTCGIVLSFLSLPSEIDTVYLHRAALSAGKLLGLPRIRDDALVFHRVDHPEALLSTNRFGIREPAASLPELAFDEDPGRDTQVLVLVPGLAFDGSGRRLGRGGGYYDRFLSLQRHAALVGICFDIQIVDRVPCGSLDVRMDWLATERRFNKCEHR